MASAATITSHPGGWNKPIAQKVTSIQRKMWLPGLVMSSPPIRMGYMMAETTGVKLQTDTLPFAEAMPAGTMSRMEDNEIDDALKSSEGLTEASPVRLRSTGTRQMVAFVIYSVLMTLLIASSYLIFWLLEQPYVAFNRDGALVFAHWYSPMVFAVPLMFAAAFSSLASGVGRLRFSEIGLEWLGIIGTIYVIVFVSLGAFLNLALGSFDIDSGDNGTIVIVLGVWLLLVGYAVKAIYDAARDSIADTMKAYLERWGF